MADISKFFPSGFVPALHETSLVNPIDSFRSHCLANGLVIDSIEDDGEIHRVPHTSSKKGALDGWYILHTDGKIPAGICGCWKEPVFEAHWKAEIGRAFTFMENVEHTKWIAEIKAKKEAERKAGQEQAAERAEDEIEAYFNASADHPYLLRKFIQPHGIKIDRAGRLVIPVLNADGKHISYQTIDSDGNKRFLKGGKIDGGFYEIAGNRKVIFICEGFATGASIYESTGYCVFVAFNCGNLGKVAKTVREMFPTSKIIIGADNDQFTDGNPGLTEAHKVAAMVHGEVVHPTFNSSEISIGKPTDFNDLHALRGPDAVRDQIELVIAPIKDKMAFEFSRVDSLELTEIQWLVDDYIEGDSLAQIFGDPGGGKSFVSIDLACCIATGTPWHGHAVKQGAVFYIAGEGHNGLARRFKAWELGTGVSLKGAPLYKSHRAAQLYDATEAAIVAEAIKQLSEQHGCIPSMIIIDTLARNMGGDENSTEDMNSFIQHLDIYLRQPYKCCVMVVHHSGAADKGRSRGSTALRGALDAEYKCQLDSGSKTITFESMKMKDAEMPASKAFAITQVPLPLLDKNGDPVQGAFLQAVDISGLMAKIGKKADPLSANQRSGLTILAALQLHYDNEIERGNDDIAKVDTDQWKAACDEKGINRQRFHDLKNALEEKGYVEIYKNSVKICQEHNINEGE
jgi:phage/plasmid primase-like uncharacterized protein